MERLGDQVQHELRRSGSRDAIPLAELTAAWPTVVGDAVARNAWPLRVARDGTLHVAAASATWAHELDLLQETILDGLRGRLGDAAPARLRFAVGPIPEPPTPREPPGGGRRETRRGPAGDRLGSGRSGRRDRRRGAPRARRESRSSEPVEGPVRPLFLVDLLRPAIWRFAGLF